MTTTKIPNPITNQLISAPDIARQTGWDRTRVHGILEFYGCLPELETPYGRGVLRYYSKHKFQEALRRYKDAAKPPAPEPARAPLVTAISFDEIHEALEAIEKRSIERDRQLAAKLDAIAVGVNLVLDHLTKPRAEAPKEVPPHEITCGDPPEQTQLLLFPDAHNPEQLSTPRASKANVVIAGLLPSQASMIEKDYGALLKLKFYTAEQASASGFSNSLRSADVLIAMVGFITHKTEDAAKSAGAKLVRVPGGMTRLRDTLHKIVVEGVDALP